MKRLILVLAVLAFALPVSAQEICVDTSFCYTALNTSDHPQVAAQAEQKTIHNADTCASAGLAASCTQAEYDTACADPELGLDCGGETVYAATADGTRAFFRDRIATHLESDAQAYLQRIANRAEDAFRALDPAGIVTFCTGIGLDTLCKP